MTLTTYKSKISNPFASTFLQAQATNKDVTVDRQNRRFKSHTEHLLMAFFANRPQKLILPERLRI
ncbi:MAG: hypothetical protein LH628_26530 [Microcoleus sp. CAN_BIN18]|nr:hypothetical protein [Microcoleus sp. CAN_BIN18]